MTLPSGWAWETLDDLAHVQGGIQKQAKRRPADNSYPFLRVASVGRGSLNLQDVHKVELFDGELERLRLIRGDLLVVEGNGSSDQIGRAAVWDGSIVDCVHQNHLIRVRPGERVLPEYLGLVWNSPAVHERVKALAASTSGLYTLSTAKVKSVAVPVCGLAEQRRIVDLVDDYLSRVDAAEVTLASVKRRAATLVPVALQMAFCGSAPSRPLLDLLAAPLMNGRSVPTSDGQGFPVLRLTAIAGEKIDLSQRKFGAWTREEALAFQVRQGDFLLARGNGSRRLVGRGALVRTEPGSVAFPDTMIRVQLAADLVDPDFFAHVWSSGPVRRQLEACAKTTAGIYKVNQKDLSRVRVPVPTLHEQRAIAREMNEIHEGVRRLEVAVQASVRRSAALRRALLGAAFSGRLTGLPS